LAVVNGFPLKIEAVKVVEEADPSMLDSDEFLSRLHHALLELHLEDDEVEGAFVVVW
ncbi:TRM112-like protein, partial [Trifolium medium]|nr:TRM112-like protein [Trifolium medium]